MDEGMDGWIDESAKGKRSIGQDPCPVSPLICDTSKSLELINKG